MFKIDIGRFIEESGIECICTYDSKPIKKIINEYIREGMCDTLRGRGKGFRSLIIQSDGYTFLCHNLIKTYINRLEKTDDFYQVGSYCIIRKDSIRQVTESLNTGNRRALAEAKKKNMYFNLAKTKAVSHYFFMKSGRIYGMCYGASAICKGEK